MKFNKGFSLLELMCVLGIVSGVAGMTVYQASEVDTVIKEQLNKQNLVFKQDCVAN